MAKAKKLPSGQWRTLVYSHTEYIDGKPKRKYESFTADTKKESEFLASQFLMFKTDTKKPEDITLETAMENYISSKSNILSPSTIRGYHALTRCCFQSLMPIYISKLTQIKIQQAVNQEAAIHSPKYVKNAYGLLSATLNTYRPELNLKITLPKAVKFSGYAPTDADIVNLLNTTKDTEMYIPILLSATCSLRRSEICGLKWKDVDFNRSVLYVKRAMVLKEKTEEQPQEWIIKAPKTFTSRREILVPQSLLNILKTKKGTHKADEFIVSLSPNGITYRFMQLIKHNNFEHFRFHDLRHYNASVMLALNVPDKYAMERGGWSTMSVMKDRYQHTFSDEKLKHETMLNMHFDNLIS